MRIYLLVIFFFSRSINNIEPSQNIPKEIAIVSHLANALVSSPVFGNLVSFFSLVVPTSILLVVV